MPLALAGAALLRPRRGVHIAAVACVGFVVLQSLILLLLPAHTATPFLYPGSQRGAWGRELTGAQVRAQARFERSHCPAARASSADPFITFVAHRRPPGGQADGFLPAHGGTTLRAVRAQIAADVPLCP